MEGLTSVDFRDEPPVDLPYSDGGREPVGGEGKECRKRAGGGGQTVI